MSELKKRLPNIATLSAMKMEKNFIAIEKGYDRQPALSVHGTMRFWLYRLDEEKAELDKAVETGNAVNILEELADLSNIIDYMAERLARLKELGIYEVY